MTRRGQVGQVGGPGHQADICTEGWHAISGMQREMATGTMAQRLHEILLRKFASNKIVLKDNNE